MTLCLGKGRRKTARTTRTETRPPGSASSEGGGAGSAQSGNVTRGNWAAALTLGGQVPP